MNLALNLAFGKRKSEQDELFIPTAKAASSHGHPFYARLNHVLAETGFDEFVEKLCARYYKEGVGSGISAPSHWSVPSARRVAGALLAG